MKAIHGITICRRSTRTRQVVRNPRLSETSKECKKQKKTRTKARAYTWKKKNRRYRVYFALAALSPNLGLASFSKDKDDARSLFFSNNLHRRQGFSGEFPLFWVSFINWFLIMHDLNFAWKCGVMESPCAEDCLNVEIIHHNTNSSQFPIGSPGLKLISQSLALISSLAQIIRLSRGSFTQ